MIRRKAKTSRIGFRIGMLVRVKRHIMDPNYPELPLGGWRGQIIQSQERPNRTYLVRWSRETLENIDPVYRERCRADDVCFHQTWLLEGDVEPDPGGPLSLEYRTNVETHAQEACSC